MSNKDENKHVNDEEFINTLYKALDSQPENNMHEKSSSELDEKIISAALSALNNDIKPVADKDIVMPEAIVDTRQPTHIAKQNVATITPLKKRKHKPKISWQLPFSLAASTILVMVLFVNQGEQAIVPAASITEEFLTNEVFDEQMPASDMLVNKNKNKNKTKTNADGAITQEAFITPSTEAKLIQGPSAADFSAKLRTTDKKVVLAPASHSGLTKVEAHSPTASGIISKPERLAKSGVQAQHLPPPVSTLSLDQFAAVKKGALTWSYVSQTQSTYFIEVHFKDSKIKRYRLSKAQFEIKIPEQWHDQSNNLKKAKRVKQPFDNITLREPD